MRKHGRRGLRKRAKRWLLRLREGAGEAERDSLEFLSTAEAAAVYEAAFEQQMLWVKRIQWSTILFVSVFLTFVTGSLYFPALLGFCHACIAYYIAYHINIVGSIFPTNRYFAAARTLAQCEEPCALQALVNMQYDSIHGLHESAFRALKRVVPQLQAEDRRLPDECIAFLLLALDNSDVEFVLDLIRYMERCRDIRAIPYMECLATGRPLPLTKYRLYRDYLAPRGLRSTPRCPGDAARIQEAATECLVALREVAAQLGDASLLLRGGAVTGEHLLRAASIVRVDSGQELLRPHEDRVPESPL